MEKRHAIIAGLLLVLLVGVVLVFSQRSDASINGLNCEAGVLRADGTVVPLTTNHGLAVIVNDVVLNNDDWVYWRFWMVLRSSGDISNAQLQSVRFRLTQTGINEAYEAGTETTVPGIPVTSPSEWWFEMPIPVGANVEVPLKYRDNWATGEGPTKLAPFTVIDNNYPVRAARVEKASNFATMAPGVYTWTVRCEVVSVSWSFYERQNIIAQTFTPSPNVLEYTFSIEVTVPGSLTITLVSEGSP